ncbi:hypothetical protein D3C83_243250 [compost metagenome]
MKAREKAEEEKRRAMDQPGAAWEAPANEATQPSVIIKKKDGAKGDEPVKVKVVPIPTETPK